MKEIKPVIPQVNANTNEGFIRLTTDEVRDNLIDTLRRVLVEGERIVLQRAGEEVAAIIPIREFERLDDLMERLKPSLYTPEEEEYYGNGIHCVYPDEVEAEFDDILEEVMLDGELFGLLQIENLGGKKIDIFAPVAILMPIDKFWIPEYLTREKQGR
jgi:PHD/YefM family antitoxin component YafN of YafNO toxin-antitoxin module